MIHRHDSILLEHGLHIPGKRSKTITPRKSAISAARSQHYHTIRTTCLAALFALRSREPPVRLIIKRTARRAAEDGLVSLLGKDLDAAIAALSTHSLRVGLTQDLFANGEDAGPIAQALRWTLTATALRYGRKLAPAANATARMLGKVRG